MSQTTAERLGVLLDTVGHLAGCIAVLEQALPGFPVTNAEAKVIIDGLRGLVWGTSASSEAVSLSYCAELLRADISAASNAQPQLPALRELRWLPYGGGLTAQAGDHVIVVGFHRLHNEAFWEVYAGRKLVESGVAPTCDEAKEASARWLGHHVRSAYFDMES